MKWKKRNTEKTPKDKLVADIIERRRYGVPIEFIQNMITPEVVNLLIQDYTWMVLNGDPTIIIETDYVGEFSTLYKMIDEVHPEYKLFSKKKLKTFGFPRLSLSGIIQDTQIPWFVRRWCRDDESISEAISLMYITGSPVIKEFLQHILKHKTSALYHYFGNHLNLGHTEVIKYIETLNCPYVFLKCLTMYWTSGGTYFPTNLETIYPYINDWCECFDLYLNAYKRNLGKDYISIGLETYKALVRITQASKKSACNPSYSISEEIKNIVDDLFRLAEKDINVLWAIVNTNIPESLYRDIFFKDERSIWEDGSYQNYFLDMIDESSIPLKDARLYSRLFGFKCLPQSSQCTFISRGGDISTLTLESHTDDMMYNVCNTDEGVREILTSSPMEDITNLLVSNENVKKKLMYDFIDNNLSYLSYNQFITLFGAILDADPTTINQLSGIMIHILELLGEDTLVRRYPSCISLLLSHKITRMSYSKLLQYVSFVGTTPYIPIKLLSSDIVLKLVSDNALDGSRYPQLNTESTYLNRVVDQEELMNHIVSKENYGYIADIDPNSYNVYIYSVINAGYK